MGRRPNQERLSKYEQVIPEYPRAVRPGQLARTLGIHRSTVLRDLPALEDQGTLLMENERGWLSLFRRRGR